jgi:ATP-binding protein involved in chromosome partitioning
MVTTPQQVAVSDVRRSIHMFRQVGVPILGIVENMSYLKCQHCEEFTYIFGSGGGEQIAAELQAPLLGKIPIEPRLCTGGDMGQPLPIAEPNSLVSQVYVQIATALDATFSTRN